MKSVMEKIGECFTLQRLYCVKLTTIISFIAFHIVDYAMSPDTVIVGDSGCQILHSNGNSRWSTSTDEYICSAVALVFAVDRNKPPGKSKIMLLQT